MTVLGLESKLASNVFSRREQHTVFNFKYQAVHYPNQKSFCLIMSVQNGKYLQQCQQLNHNFIHMN